MEHQQYALTENDVVILDEADYLLLERKVSFVYTTTGKPAWTNKMLGLTATASADSSSIERLILKGFGFETFESNIKDPLENCGDGSAFLKRSLSQFLKDEKDEYAEYARMVYLSKTDEASLKAVTSWMKEHQDY